MRHGFWLTACFLLTGTAAAQAPRLITTGEPPTAATVPQATSAEVVADAGPAAILDLDDSCRPACPPRCWAGGEYLFWWMRGNPIPPLATIGSTADAAPGALGQPGTRPAFDDSISYPGSHGARVTVGGWLGEQGRWGWEASGFILERQASHPSVFDPSGADPTQVLAVPILLPAGPAGLTALDAMFVDSNLQIWSAEANFLRNLRRNGNRSLDAFIGFRYFDLDESLTMTMPLTGTAFINGFDSFRAQNLFYAGQLGAKLNWRRDRASLDLVGKVALGSNHRALTVSGIDTRDGVPTDVGVFFADVTNLGRHTDDTFAILPEAQVKVGYDLTSQLRATAGYNFLYMTNVLRAGGGIDPVSAPGRPAPRFDDSSFWAHGVSLGVEVRW